ncbi:MAG TPA: branched-chain amino acid ABC transporter permease [Solirubrobacteraceae bacterium]|nr:branched-chain amino acid ABC transporter permease [Solirubrobacteraceae bacterium]
MPIGVDEWVAQHTDRQDAGTGLRRWLFVLDSRVGWWQRWALAVIAGIVFGQLGFNSNIQTVAVTCVIYAILSVGLNIAAGWAGLLDLGYVAFFGFGAYGYALFSSDALGSGGSGGAHLSALVSFPIVLAAAALFGALIGLATLRVSGDYLAIVTLFVGQAFMEVVNNVDPGTLGGVNGLFGLDPVHAFGARITTVGGYYYLALGCLAVVLALLHLLDGSRTGRAWRAVREDELAARAMTVPVGRLKVMAISFGATVGALAGAIFAAQQDSVFPTNFTENILILIYACLVLGGSGSLAGAVLGGIVVIAGEQLVSSPNDAGWLFYGLILLTLAIKLRPWLRLAAVLAATVAFGLVARLIVGAISAAATAGHAGSGGLIGSLVSGWVIVPANAATYGNVLFVVMIVLVFALVRVPERARLWLVVPTIYLAACCWESRLVVNPAITAQILIGAILIAMMSARPQGLLGTMRVEVV